jgi:hypothetical protein
MSGARSVALVACLLLAPLGVATVGAATGAGSVEPAAPDATTATTPPIDGIVRHEVHLAGPGRVVVELGVGTTGRTTEFSVSLPRDATVTRTDGFERAGGRTYEWDGLTDDPAVTYTVPANRTVGGSLRFAATADWALVDLTTLDAAYSWRSFGDPDYERRFAVPSGHAGASMAYLGASTRAEATAAGQRFVVVVPEAARTNATAGEFAGSLAGIARSIPVGARDPTVTAFVAPAPIGTDGGEGGLGGLATDADLWVAAADATGTGANATRVNEPIWTHEYVHTAQEFTTTPRMAWFSEASAFYYMALTPYQRGTITERAFDRRFDVPAERRGAVLTRTTGAQYRTWATKGPRTLAALDRRVRSATNGSRTLADVFRRLNAHDGNVSYAVFRAAVAETTDASQADWLDAHVAGDALAPRPVPDAYPASNVSVDPAGAEWERDDEWVPLAREPLPAGIDVRVRHPAVGVVVRPAGTTTPVNVSGGDPATVRLPTGEADLRVGTFYGRNATAVTVATSEDVDGDGVSNAAEVAQGSDPYDPASSTPTPEPRSPDQSDGNDGTEATTGDGAGFGVLPALVAAALLALAMRFRRR